MKNFYKARKWALEEHENKLRIIRIANRISRKIQLLLPKGWICEIDSLFWLNFKRGTWTSEEKFDPGEFKLVCGIVEKLLSKKFRRDVSIEKETNEIKLLKADMNYYENGISFWINVYLYNPEFIQDCEIEWTTETKQVAKVSNKCLGLS